MQTPLLALLVDRELEIRAFTPTPYWEIYASLKDGVEFTAKHECNRFEDKKTAEKVYAKLGKTGIVDEYRKGSRPDTPPIPFSTTEFIRAASSIGYSAANAMRIAESLYVNGWTSYPRTDNTVYPPSLNLRDILATFSSGEFGAYARKLLEGPITPTRGKKETTDHPPIYPVASARKSDMRDDEWKVYELIVRRFFATLAPAASWDTQNIVVDISGEKFKASGSRMTVAGWRHYYPYGMPKEEPLPEVKEGEALQVKKTDLLEKVTTPPTRYGQGRLVKMMEDLGLGTKSTRHETIQKLYARNYVHGNPPQPTNLAVRVVEALEKHADMITKPDMTSRLESDMDEIADGKIKEEAVVDESQTMLETIFTILDKNHDEIRGVLYEGLREDKIIGKCQICGSDLMVRKSKKGSRFIGCSGYPDCRFSLPLPPSGNIVVTNKMCENHGLSHIKIITSGKKPWELGCPQCNFEAWQKEKEKKAAEAGIAGAAVTATAPKKKPAEASAAKTAGTATVAKKKPAAPRKKKVAEKPSAV